MTERDMGVLEKRYRIICSETQGFIRHMPFEVTGFVKMLFRDGDWKPWNEDKDFEDLEKALEDLDMIGCLASTENKNSYVFDIEEIYK